MSAKLLSQQACISETERDSAAVRLQSFYGADFPVRLSRKIRSDLTRLMPSYGVSDYFETKTRLMEGNAFVVLVQNPVSTDFIGIIVAGYLRQFDNRVLNIRTILIAENQHRSNVIKLLWKGLYNKVISAGYKFPDIITFKTYSPKSYSAMATFSQLPGVDMFPSISSENSSSCVVVARQISEVLSPGCEFDDGTGVIYGASEGVNSFYKTLPLCGRTEIDNFFKQHITQADRLLCCLFVHTAAAARRIVRAFGGNTKGIRF